MQVPREIIVSFSGGKDANATLDICSRQFDRIEAFFLYWVKGLEFQELVLERAERTYGVKILRLPHFSLPAVLGEQVYGFYGANYPQFRPVRMREVQDYVRGKFGMQWIASGEKKSDSFTRRFMMMASSQWDQKRFHYYPLMDWTNTQVYSYLRMRHIPLPPEYRWLKTSWGDIRGEELFHIRRHFPRDYRRILEVFPYAEAIERRYEIYRATGKDGAAEVHNAADAAIGTDGGAVQSTTD